MSAGVQHIAVVINEQALDHVALSTFVDDAKNLLINFVKLFRNFIYIIVKTRCFVNT